MKNRLPMALAVTALVVALLGSTGIAQAATVSFALNAGRLLGFKPSKTSKKNTVVVRGVNGKIDAASIPAQARGARGLAGATGPVGPAGAQGAQGIQGPPGAPNPNADTLNGYAANQLSRAAFVRNDGDNYIEADGNTDIASVVLNAPRQSLVRASFTGYAIANTLTGCPCVMQGLLRQDAGAATIVTNVNLAIEAADFTGSFDRRDFSGSMVFLASPGNHTYTFSIVRQQGSSTGIGASYVSLEAELFPFGAAGAPAAVETTPAQATVSGSAR